MAGRHYGPAWVAGNSRRMRRAAVMTLRGRGGKWRRVAQRAARRGPEGQAQCPGGEAGHRPARGRVLQEEPGSQGGDRRGRQGDRTAHGLGPARAAGRA